MSCFPVSIAGVPGTAGRAWSGMLREDDGGCVRGVGASLVRCNLFGERMAIRMTADRRRRGIIPTMGETVACLPFGLHNYGVKAQTVEMLRSPGETTSR
jgi:hypothetical protein